MNEERPEEHKRLLMTVGIVLPEYTAEITPEKVNTMLRSVEGRMRLRQIFRDLAWEAKNLESLV